MSTESKVNHETEGVEVANSIDKESLAISHDEWEGTISLDPSLERTVWRKMDLFILPVASAMSFFSLLDLGNFGNARIAGLQSSLHMSNNQFSLTTTISSIPFILSELPLNLLLRNFGANFVLPTILTLWGIITVCEGFVKNWSSLLACRVFLGMMEGGIMPGLVLYLSEFYPREKLHLRVGIFISSASLALAFSGLLAYGIVHMDGLGGKPGWAWIFIIEGLVTVVFGLFSHFIIPRTPGTARFLSRVEKDYITKQLSIRGGSSGIRHQNDNFSWRGIAQALKEAGKTPQVWFTPFMFFPGGVVTTGLGIFTPSIVLTFGYSPIRSQLMSVPPFALAFVVTLLVAWLSDRYRRRGLAAISMILLSIVGLALFLASTNRHVRYASLLITISGRYSATPALSAWTANNVAPHLRRAIAIAISFVVFNCGSILSGWLLAGTLSPPPRYTKAIITMLVLEIVGLIAILANFLYLYNENKKKAVRRQQGSRQDEDPNLGDKSAWFIYSL